MSDIVTVPTGDFTPGAKATLEFAAATINAAWEQANTKTTDFETKITAAEAFLDTAPVADITADVAAAPTIIEPTVAIPSTLQATDVLSLFSTQYLELVALLADKFVDFRGTYFPNEADVYSRAETWLHDALDPAHPGSALPPAIAAQLLEDDRTRILADASRASDAVMANFAARRFPLPPGAATSATLQIQQKAQEEIASSGRKLTAASLELMKFAIDRALGLRQQAMTAAVDYIRALASGPDMASRVIGVGYDAQSKLIAAAASYYNARSEAKRVITQVDQFNVTSKLTADEKNQAVDLALVEDRLKLLIAEAQALAGMAQSMFNNLHASSGTSYQVAISATE